MPPTLKEPQDATPHPASAFGNAYLFAGRRFDDQTGLYYNRHRYYDARSGRFINRDPLGYIGCLNLYAYAAHNPLNAVDPMGLDFQYLGWKWGKPKGGVKGRTYAYYRVRLRCVCKKEGPQKGYWFIEFIDADVRLRIILNQKFKKRFQSIQNGKLTDQSGNTVSATDLTFEDKKGNTVPTSFGIYGHEMKHVESVKAAYNAAMGAGGKLRSQIDKMERIAHGNRSSDKCAKEISKNGYWRNELMKLLKEVIDEGAGHDTVANTTKPEDSTTYRPPGGTMQPPEKKWKKLTKSGYTQYPLPETW